MGHVQVTHLEDSFLPLTSPGADLFLAICSLYWLQVSPKVNGISLCVCIVVYPLSIHQYLLEEQCRIKCLESSLSPSSVNEITLYVYASSTLFCAHPHWKLIEILHTSCSNYPTPHLRLTKRGGTAVLFCFPCPWQCCTDVIAGSTACRSLVRGSG